MSLGRSRWACRALRGLRPQPHRLQLVPQSPPAFAGAGYCPKCQGGAAQDWLAARQADLLPIGYFHVVFTLPAEIGPIAYQNKAVGRRRSRDTADDCSGSQASRRPHWCHRRAPYLGLDDDPEPSLMMPGIIISLIFREQGKLVRRATPLQDQLAGAVEAIDNLANGFGIQITAANFPRCPTRYLPTP